MASARLKSAAVVSFTFAASNVANGNNPTMPPGYTYKRRIGWCVTDA